MQILDDIKILSEVMRPRRHRADEWDPAMVDLREGRAVELTESEELNAMQMRTLAGRLAARARRRGLKQTRHTTLVAGRRVLTVQWYRETLGDLIEPAVHPMQLRLVLQEA